MNEQTYTPGPWAVDDGHEVYSVPRHTSVCMVLATSEAEANARLIAASPLMLDALKDVRQWLGVDLFNTDDVYHERCKRSLILIRAAIARATGGEE